MASGPRAGQWPGGSTRMRWLLLCAVGDDRRLNPDMLFFSPVAMVMERCCNRLIVCLMPDARAMQIGEHGSELACSRAF